MAASGGGSHGAAARAGRLDGVRPAPRRRAAAEVDAIRLDVRSTGTGRSRLRPQLDVRRAGVPAAAGGLTRGADLDSGRPAFLGGRVDRSTARENADVRASAAGRLDPAQDRPDHRMKSWEQRERAQVTLAKEIGYVRKPHGDRLRVALAFPNTYWVGMSNLGFQTVYRLFNAEDDIVCERVFLPPKQELAELSAAKTPLVTLESQTPVGDFDVVAFSVSFEWDYVNVLTLLRLAGIPRYAAERTDAPSAHRRRRRRDVREPRAAGAVRRRDRRRRRRSARARPAPRAFARGDRSRRPAAPARRASAASTSRRSTSRSTRADGTMAGYAVRRGRRRADAGAQGGAEDDRRARSAGDRASSRPTPSSDRASSSKSSAAAPTCAASAGPATTTCRSARFRPIASCSSREAARVALEPRRPRVDRALRSSRTSSAFSRGLLEMGYAISPASLRLDDLTESIVRVLQRERRADDHDRAGNRIRSPAPRDQQDGHERRDPRSRRADLRQRHREPEALLHDRPPHRNRRRPRGDSRSDAADARPDDEARARRGADRPHRRQREPADSRSRAPRISGCRWKIRR